MSKKDTKNKTVQMTVVEDNEVTNIPSKVPAEEEPAWVTYELKRTVNMGDYESLSVKIGVTVPCRRKEISTVYKQAGKFVEKKMDQKLAKWGFK